MESLYVVSPNVNISNSLEDMCQSFCKNFTSVEYITNCSEHTDFKNKKLLFILELDFTGFDLFMLNFLLELNHNDKNALENSTAMVLVHSSTELGTKRAAQDIIFMANNMGCNFLGHPIIECTGSLKNFLTWQKTLNNSLEEICLDLCYKLGRRLLDYKNTLLSMEKEKKITV